MIHVIATRDSSWLNCLHAPNEQPRRDQSENLFRALKSNYLEENKADLSTYSQDFYKKAESLAGNGEVVARHGFQDPIVN